MDASVLDFSGRTIVVSGAASGIGKATARLAARLGATVVVWDVKGTACVVRDIEAGCGNTLAVECDVADRGAVETVAERIGPVYGSSPARVSVPWKIGRTRILQAV